MRFIIIALLLLLLGVFTWWQRSGQALSPDETGRLMDWLTCDECTDGELEFVTGTLGNRARPLLGRALLSDSIDFLDNARAAIAATWSENPLPGSDSALYVEYFAANLEAQVRKRSAVALGILGDTVTLRLATEQAGPLGLRDDVVVAIGEARRVAGAPGLPPPTPERVLLRPSDVTVRVGDTVSLEALGRTADSARAVGTVTWVSADPATASVSSPDPAHARVAGESPGATTVTATMGTASATATVTVVAPPPPPSGTFAAISGTGQVVLPGGSPAQALVVRAESGGSGLPGITVTWTASGPGMGPVQAVAITDAAGRASYLPTLGTTEGVYWVTASAGPFTVRFQLRVVP